MRPVGFKPRRPAPVPALLTTSPGVLLPGTLLDYNGQGGTPGEQALCLSGTGCLRARPSHRRSCIKA